MIITPIHLCTIPNNNIMDFTLFENEITSNYNTITKVDCLVSWTISPNYVVYATTTTK